jgi:hypothetical protein
MPGAALAGQDETNAFTGDFELVRNAAGEWLLILSTLPDALLDNPLAEVSLQLDGEQIVICSTAAPDLRIDSILAAEYVAGLRADAPQNLLLCVINAEGTRTFSRACPLGII